MAWLRSARRNWERWRGLDRADRRMLLQALFLLPFVALTVRVWGLRRCQALLARWSPSRAPLPPANEAMLQAQSMARMVKAAAGHGLASASCLHQSIVLAWLLRRRGIDANLWIGTRRNAGRFDAHAWVEFQGLALNDRGDVRERFAVFERAIA